MAKTRKVTMEFISLCDRCPVEKMCELVAKRFEVVTCDAHDFAVKELKKAGLLEQNT